MAAPAHDREVKDEELHLTHSLTQQQCVWVLQVLLRECGPHALRLFLLGVTSCCSSGWPVLQVRSTPRCRSCLLQLLRHAGGTTTTTLYDLWNATSTGCHVLLQVRNAVATAVGDDVATATTAAAVDVATAATAAAGDGTSCSIEGVV